MLFRSGGYHGFSDFVMVGGHDFAAPEDGPARLGAMPDTAGLPPAATADILLLRYNDIEGSRRALRMYGDQLAAVIVEPMLGSAGVIPAHREYLEMLRSETLRTGTLLICDEVISLRQAHGGLQSSYDLTPDITTMAKIIGGG